MSNHLIPTEHPGYYRDPNTKGIVHRNETAHEMFLNQRRQARENKELSEKVVHLSDELAEIKSLLVSVLLNKQNR